MVKKIEIVRCEVRRETFYNEIHGDLRSFSAEETTKPSAADFGMLWKRMCPFIQREVLRGFKSPVIIRR